MSHCDASDSELERKAAAYLAKRLSEELPGWLSVMPHEGGRHVELAFSRASRDYAIRATFPYKYGKACGLVSVTAKHVWDAEPEVQFQTRSFKGLVRRLRERFPAWLWEEKYTESS